MLSLKKTKPTKLIIRAYQVGFGDCFLLTFQYPGPTKKSPTERHVLVDFGSTGMPEGVSPDQMMAVAEDIKERCDGKLHMVVATHRHKDHISGFTTKDGKGTGDVIASLSPDVVVQPWTENPKTKDPKLKSKGKKSKKEPAAETLRMGNLHYLAALDDMHAIAEAMTKEVTHLASSRFQKPLNEELGQSIQFLSADNSLPNRSAVDNLKSMGEHNHYVNYGYDLDLKQTLPGVKVHVLGPPTLEQHAEIQKERARDANEFWMLQGAARAFWGLQAASGEMVTELNTAGERLFPGAGIYEDFNPIHTRWIIRRLRKLRGQQLLGLVRILDKAMNNTSVILLFEIGGKKLLFPGDAQIENWEYALSIKETTQLLKDTHFYKVGHHGSRNATPKTLWKNFARKGPKSQGDRLQTMVSTMKGKHGDKKNHSEVPRSTLVTELENNSTYSTTETAAKANELYLETTIDF